MADESLLGLSPADLVGFQNSVLQNDPYALSARSLGAWQPDMRTWDAPTQGFSAFAKAFATGMLGNLARQNAADQVNSVIGVLPALRSNPMAAVAPEGVDADAFAALKGTAILKNAQAQTYRQNTLQDLLQKVGVAGLTKQAEIMGEREAYQKLGELDPSSAEGKAEAARLQKIAEIRGTQAGYESIGQGGQNPDSPAYKIGQDMQSAADSLRKEFNLLPEVKNFKEVANRFDTLKRGLLDKNAITDTDFAISLAKIYDPTSVVRETESGQVIDSQSVPNSVLGRINKALTGEQALDTQARLALINSAKRHYDTQKAAFDLASEKYGSIADTRELDRSQVLSKIGSAYSFGQPELAELAKRFPATPEGREAFKAAIGILR